MEFEPVFEGLPEVAGRDVRAYPLAKLTWIKRLNGSPAGKLRSWRTSAVPAASGKHRRDEEYRGQR